MPRPPVRRTLTGVPLRCAIAALALVCCALLVSTAAAVAGTNRRPGRASCRHHPRRQGCRKRPTLPMRLTSPAFASGGSIPSLYTCSGRSISPPLAWSHIPIGTRDLELLVTDPDAPSGPVSHWVLYDIPPTDHNAPQDAPPPGAQQGMNTFGTRSYLPPCPIPPGSVHHYTFELFATNRPLKFRSPPKDADIRAAVKGHTLATARLIGTYALA